MFCSDLLSMGEPCLPLQKASLLQKCRWMCNRESAQLGVSLGWVPLKEQPLEGMVSDAEDKKRFVMTPTPSMHVTCPRAPGFCSKMEQSGNGGASHFLVICMCAGASQMSTHLLPRNLHGSFCFSKPFIKDQHIVGIQRPSVEGMDMDTGSAGFLFCSLCQSCFAWVGRPPHPPLQSYLPGLD